MENATHESLTLGDYLAVLARRWWALVLPVALLTLAAVWYAERQPERYEATAQVLVTSATLQQNLIGNPGTASVQGLDRTARSQAALAVSPALVDRVLDEAGTREVSVASFLAVSDVSVVPDANVLRFSVRDPEAGRAAQLATLYAREFVGYQRSLELAAIRRARRGLEQQLEELERQARAESPEFPTVVARIRNLRSLEALQVGNTALGPAHVRSLRADPRRFALLALGLGLLLGAVLAFLAEALDPRVRSTREIESALGVPLLGRVARPPRRLQRAGRLVMLAEPGSRQAEAFRILRGRLELANRERRASVLMLTSAAAGEGASTTAANLAIALARAGRRVCLVDADIRAASLHELFVLGERPGLTDVAAGRAGLEEALVPVATTTQEGAAMAEGNGKGLTRLQGVLELLPAGFVPSDGGDFLAGKAVADVLEGLRERADLVLLAGPPLLEGGDGIALSVRVDAVLLVARLRVLRRSALRELQRAFDLAPSSLLGFVLTGARLRRSLESPPDAAPEPRATPMASAEEARARVAR